MTKRFVRRSWGWYWTILDRKHFKVKLLRFRKDKRCSLQYHNHRNELWLFLKGSGCMFDGYPNHHFKSYGDWCLIWAGQKHTFHPEKTTYILEIQYGEKCDEEDIVRI